MLMIRNKIVLHRHYFHIYYSETKGLIEQVPSKIWAITVKKMSSSRLFALWPRGWFGCVAFRVSKEINTPVVAIVDSVESLGWFTLGLGLEWQTDAKAFSGFSLLSWLYTPDCKRARHCFLLSLLSCELLGFKSNIVLKIFVWLKETTPWG